MGSRVLHQTHSAVVQVKGPMAAPYTYFAYNQEALPKTQGSLKIDNYTSLKSHALALQKRTNRK